MSLFKRSGVILLVFAIAGSYYFITRQPTVEQKPPVLPALVVFFCSMGGEVQAAFATSSVALMLPDGRSLSLPQVMSGSGIRYEATLSGVDTTFISKGDNAFITEGARTTYEDCTAAHVAQAGQGYETYADQSENFSLTFPTDFRVAGSAVGYTQGWSADATTTGMVLAHIEVPQSYEPGTNFGDARFTVGVSADPSALADCFKTSYGEHASSTQDTIGDTPFTKLSFSGVGAGNLYESTSYRTVRAGQCYAVEYTIHSANIGNYEPGAVKAFDKARIQSALEAVVHSFRFLR